MLISVQWLSLVSNKFTDTQFFENSAAKSEAEGLIGRTDYSICLAAFFQNFDHPFIAKTWLDT